MDKEKTEHEIKSLEQQIKMKESYVMECKEFSQPYFDTLADIRHLKVRLHNKKLQIINWGGSNTVRETVSIPSYIKNLRLH